MKAMTLSNVAKLIGGRVIGDGDVVIQDVSTDTRKLPDADGRALLFIALRGENFDGHAHVVSAAERGAAAALVAYETDVAIPQIIVADTERALGALARGLQRERSTKVFAVTGSNGKTSVKTLLLSILDQAGGAYANPEREGLLDGLLLALASRRARASAAARSRAAFAAAARNCANTRSNALASCPKAFSRVALSRYFASTCANMAARCLRCCATSANSACCFACAAASKVRFLLISVSTASSSASRPLMSRMRAARSRCNAP